MMVGMAVLGGVFRVALAGLGLDSDEAQARFPAVFALVMAFNMTAPMAWWMRRRGHGWRYTAEMVAAMFVPVLALIPPLWLGAISGDTLSGIQHAVMIPSMVVVMLRRRTDLADRRLRSRLKDAPETALGQAVAPSGSQVSLRTGGLR